MQCENYIIEPVDPSEVWKNPEYSDSINPQENGQSRVVRCPAEGFFPLEEKVAGQVIELSFCFECVQAIRGD